MTDRDDDFERERVTRILIRLPEKEFALYQLGALLHSSFQQADIRRTPADRAYVAEVAKRLYDTATPALRDTFAVWLEPGGVLRLWEN